MPEAEAVSAVKVAPPEKREAIKMRAWVVFSFWAVALFLGLPVWLWTTSIHRAALPLQEMLDWADGKACIPTFPLQIAIEARTLTAREADHLIEMLQHATDSYGFSVHTLKLTNGHTPEREGGQLPALTLNMVPSTEEESIRTELQPHSSVLDVFYNPSQAISPSEGMPPLVDTVARALQVIFAEERASIGWTLVNSQSALHEEQSEELFKVLSPDLALTLQRRQKRSVKYSPSYHIAISLFTPSSQPNAWDIENAIQQYLQPLLSSFSISSFTVDTQVQIFADFAPSFPSPEFDEEHQIWTLPQESLSSFINAAEWPLSPSIGSGLTLNFVLYVPDAKNTPLVVKETNANNWLVPQWGGVHILNQIPDASTIPETLAADQIRPAMLTFSRQLLALLGAPNSPPSLELQISSMTRVRAANLLLSASSTLGSMARLTERLNQIPIPENVAATVDRTLSDLRNTCDALKHGRFDEALRHARNADMQAERAFFEKSMVGQVYFPDEHKVAVYLPLLAPISVPLITTAMKVIRQLRALPKAKAA